MEPNESEKKEKLKRAKYGTMIPNIAFSEIIEIIKMVIIKTGEHNTYDALSRVTGNSSSSSTFQKKVRALRNHGVMEFDKSNYSLTPLGKKIAEPESFDEQAKAIIEAFGKEENLKEFGIIIKGKDCHSQNFWLTL